MREQGSFEFADEAWNYAELNEMFN